MFRARVLHARTLFRVLVALGLSACQQEAVSDQASTGTQATSEQPTSSTTRTTLTPDESASASQQVETTATSSSDNTNTTTSDESTQTEALSLGSACNADQQCFSNTCATVETRSLDGQLSTARLCSACRTHQDCQQPETDGPYCSLRIQGATNYLACSKGKFGDSCTRDDQCAQPGTCAMIPRDTGHFACSECNSNEACLDPAKPRCLVEVDQKDLTLYRACAEPRSNGSRCSPRLGETNGECKEYCVSVPNAGANFGICGACRSNQDCVTGRTCQPPRVIEGLVPKYLPSECIE